MARTNRTPKIRLGELLVAAGLLSEDKVRIGLEEQRRNNLFLGEALVQLGFVTEDAIAQAIIQHFNLPFLSAQQFNLPPDVFNLFPVRMYHEYQFIAVDKIANTILIVAAGPINQDMMEELERVSSCRIYHYVSTWNDIRQAIEKNSKELGGEAQVELTGLGSMLLEVPKSERVGTATISKSVRPGPSQVIPGVSMTGMPTVPSQRAAPAKASMASMSSAGLSALLSPLGVNIKNPVNGPPSVRPPTARLTAFLKAVPGGSSSNMSAIKSGQFQAMNITASPSVSGFNSVSPTGTPAVLPPSRPGAPPAPELPKPPDAQRPDLTRPRPSLFTKKPS